jgi:hypothetical protein
MMQNQETNKDELSSPGEGRFAELRESVASIADDLKQLAEGRARAAKEHTEEGVQNLRKAIHRQPALAMGIALLVGAGLALVTVPSGGRRSPYRSGAWMPSIPSISRADLYDFADAIQHKAVQAANSVPITSSLERLADAISKIEPTALGSAFGKIGDLIQKIRTSDED